MFLNKSKTRSKSIKGIPDSLPKFNNMEDFTDFYKKQNNIHTNNISSDTMDTNNYKKDKQQNTKQEKKNVKIINKPIILTPIFNKKQHTDINDFKQQTYHVKQSIIDSFINEYIHNQTDKTAITTNKTATTDKTATATNKTATATDKTATTPDKTATDIIESFIDEYVNNPIENTIDTKYSNINTPFIEHNHISTEDVIYEMYQLIDNERFINGIIDKITDKITDIVYNNIIKKIDIYYNDKTEIITRHIHEDITKYKDEIYKEVSKKIELNDIKSDKYIVPIKVDNDSKQIDTIDTISSHIMTDNRYRNRRSFI